MTSSLYHAGQHNYIQSSVNYRQFTFDKRNRPINPEHLERLYDAVSEKNFLQEFPILVDRNMVVIDGQHRLRVAEALGVPIYYLVSDRISIDDVPATVQVVGKWRPMDYLHSWCAAGKIEYIKLRDWWQQHNFLSLSRAYELCYFGDHSSRGDRKTLAWRFVNGEYIANDIPFATKVIQNVLDFEPWVPFHREALFIYAVSNLTGNAKYDHRQMMNKMEYLSIKLVKCPDTESYIKLFDEIYNHKRRRSERVTLRKLSPSDPDYRVDRKPLRISV